MGFTGFYRVWLVFMNWFWVLTGFYLISIVFNNEIWIWEGLTWFLPSFADYYHLLLGFTGFFILILDYYLFFLDFIRFLWWNWEFRGFFTWFLPSFAHFYHLFLGFTGLLPSFTGLHQLNGIKWVLMGFTELFKDLIKCWSRYSVVLLGFTGFCRVSISIIGFYWVLPSFSTSKGAE